MKKLKNLNPREEANKEKIMLKPARFRSFPPGYVPESPKLRFDTNTITSESDWDFESESIPSTSEEEESSTQEITEKNKNVPATFMKSKLKPKERLKSLAHKRTSVLDRKLRNNIEQGDKKYPRISSHEAEL